MSKSSTVIVNVDPEIALKLAAYAAELGGDKAASTAFMSECNDFAAKGDIISLVDKLLSKSAAVFATDNLSDIEGYFQGILFVVQYYMQHPQWQGVVSKLIDAVAVQAPATNATRLAALVALFNLSEDARCRYMLLQAAFSFALATEQSALVARFHVHVEGWVAQWAAASVVTLADQRALFRLVADTITAAANTTSSTTSSAPSSGSPSVPASVGLQFLTRSLATYATGDANAELQATAETAIIQALAMCGPGTAVEHAAAFKCRNDLFYCLNSISSKLTANAAQLMSLLRIVCMGDLASFVAQYSAAGSAGAALLSTNNISAEKVEHTLRLLTICALVETEQAAASKGTAGGSSSALDGATVIMQFNTIAKNMHLAAEIMADAEATAMEVEFWVVEAIASRLIDATINQVTQSVTVNRYAHMVAGPGSNTSNKDSMAKQLMAIRNAVATSFAATTASAQQ